MPSHFGLGTGREGAAPLPPFPCCSPGFLTPSPHLPSPSRSTFKRGTPALSCPWTPRAHITSCPPPHPSQSLSSTPRLSQPQTLPRDTPTLAVGTYLLGSAPLKYALTVSVKAAATGRVSCAPMVRGLGPRDEPATEHTAPLGTCRPPRPRCPGPAAHRAPQPDSMGKSSPKNPPGFG